MRVALAVLLLALAGCGGHAQRTAVSRDGRAVLRDAYDGKLDRNWTCASLEAALARLPPSPPIYSPLPRLLDAALAEREREGHGSREILRTRSAVSGLQCASS